MKLVTHSSSAFVASATYTVEELVETPIRSRLRKTRGISKIDEDFESLDDSEERKNTQGKYGKRGRPCSKSSYVNIAHLLRLPQKEAADALGISESMLCKRFKECTKRKWPYRYLRKVEKQILLKRQAFPDEASMPPMEMQKLKQLLREREMCLEPVSIRLTGGDLELESGDVTVPTEGSSSSLDEQQQLRTSAESAPKREKISPAEEEAAADDDFFPANILLALGGGC